MEKFYKIIYICFMSEKNDKKKNENDPYDFFKLNVDDNKEKKGPGKKPGKKFPENMVFLL